MKHLRVLLGLVIFAPACGPMNTPEEDTSKEVSNDSTAKESVNNQYYLSISLVDSNDSPTDSSPTTGENSYKISCVNSSDLSMISETAIITAVYEMPEMPEMGQIEETAIRQADGTYRVSVVYSMRGKWQVTVKIQDGGSQDSYVFETTL